MALTMTASITIENVQVHKLASEDASVPVLERSEPSERVRSVTDALGGVTRYFYDARGRVVRIEDPNGNTTGRVYDQHGDLVLETYKAATADSFGEVLSTRYIYDAEHHLRFAISADGRVTESQYNSFGQLVLTLQYTDVAYEPSSDLPELNDMVTWAGTADQTKAQVVEYQYDARGNLTDTYTYGVYDPSGANHKNVRRQHFVYDQFGQLLETITNPVSIDPDSGARAPSEQKFVYDGLGRVIASTDLASGAINS